MADLKVSIALCTYNGEIHLPEQLDSYLTQTHLPDELVVCDDCSTDNTISILQHFADNAPFPVQVVRNEQQLGGPMNFEKALRLCSGDLIFFSDQDDVWKPHKVAAFLRFAASHPERWGFFSNAALLQEGQILDYSLWDAVDFTAERVKETGFDDLADSFFMHRSVTYGATLGIRREALPVILPFRFENERMWHDEWIALSLSLQKRYAYINEPLINYRIHSGQEVGLRWLAHPSVASSEKLYTSLEQSGTPRDSARLRMVQSWLAYSKACRYRSILPSLTGLMQHYYNQYRAAQTQFLKEIPFLERKARLAKWYWKSEFDTTLSDVLRR